MYLNHKINYNNGDKLNASAWNSLASDVNELGQAIENVSSVSDKTYNSAQHSGLGVKELKMNGSNVLAQSDFQNANTIYNVTYDFNLNNAEITMPQGSVLNLDGGSFTNGRIISNDTILKGQITDATKACLFGVFYDENKNPLGWDKNRITDWNTYTEYGNFIHSIQRGLEIGQIKAVATDNNYVYLLFSDTSDPINNTIVLYDRNYNYIGYSRLNRHCSIEGACIYNNNMYVACGTNVSDNDSIFTINISTIISNCAYNKGKSVESARTTDVTPIRLGFNCVSIDYDSVTNTFCLGTPTAFYKIYDTQFNLIKTSNIINYSQFGFNDFGRQSCRQDFVYQNGIIYALDNDQDTATHGLQSDGVLYTIDVATDKVILVQPIDYQTKYCTNCGLCKDPVTNNIFIACNNKSHSSKEYPFFTVVSISNELKKVSNTLKNPVDSLWSADTDYDSVWVDNSYTSGRSYGFFDSPYKTLGEAIIMNRGRNKAVFGIRKGTGEPYYIKGMRLHDSSISIQGIYGEGDLKVTENTSIDEFPILDIKMDVVNTYVNIAGVIIEPSDKHTQYPFDVQMHGNTNAVVCAANGSIVTIYENVTFKFHQGNPIRRIAYVFNNSYVRASSFTVESDTDVNGYIYLSVGGQNGVSIWRVVADTGRIVDTGNIGQACLGNHIYIGNPSEIHLTGSALICNNQASNPYYCTVDGMVQSVDSLNTIKTLFKAADGSRNLPDFSISFVVKQDITDTNNNVIPRGMYTNVSKTVNGTVHYYLQPLWETSNNLIDIS